MIIRVCPYCDQKMTKKHRCESCGSFVWKAKVFDTEKKYTSYDIDTRYSQEPENMRENVYMRESAYMQEGEDTQNPGSISEPYSPEPAVSPEPVPAAAKTKPKEKKSSVTAAKVTAAVVIAAMVMMILGGIISSVADSQYDYAPDENYSEEDLWSDDTWTDLSYEDISGYTQSCSAYLHLPIDGEALSESTQNFFETHGYSFESSEPYFYGYHETDPFEEICYEWDYSADLGEGVDESVYINYDAVTNEVHDITLALSSRADAAAYILMVLQDFMGADTVELSEIEALFDAEEGERAYYDSCEIAVYPVSYFDGYNINIQRTSDPYDYAQEPETREIISEEIESIGQECNVSTHMDISREEAVSAVENWMEQNGMSGYQFSNDYTVNNVQTYTQLGGHTYERITLNSFSAWHKDEDNSSVLVEVDSYSGRTHCIYVNGFTMDNLETVLELIVEIAGTGDAGEIADTYLPQVESDKYAFAELNGFEIYLSAYDDNICDVQLYAID